ncbi:methyltransferase domain-containing protein [Gilvimarinus sp. 1_MG-2023]|uniref:methyltransferase domain-containing protein n=1 Tax=Gilvimarinus sp. 1_MG-2023 TaxID=3062638 RepID=UPI0026E3E708|nr:methyltransferase domain-containing protein [Gilvimarinus sp. 1_MG-2023]MDO6745752.1 methyltransferase domain-containing protein [Gilvimarinus sp. 1_MG-2023]
MPIAPYVPLTPDKTCNILDAGGGQGQFSLPLAAAGHSLTLCDLSQKMLSKAKIRAAQLGAEGVRYIHSPIQSLPETVHYDVILCHAVMEWVVDPQALLQCLWHKIQPGGYVSIIFYNHHALVYKNLLRANYKKVIAADYRASRGSLTPINPIEPEQVLGWADSLGAELLCHSGIRVFHDYILDPQSRQQAPDQVIELELSYSRRPPFRDLGRYVHLLLRKPMVED